MDLRCGAGLDALIAAMKAGPDGMVVGVDFSKAMLARAQCAARVTRQRHLLSCGSPLAALPVGTGSIDVAMVNGIFNLNPERGAIFSELARVLKGGGVVLRGGAHPTRRSFA